MSDTDIIVRLRAALNTIARSRTADGVCRWCDKPTWVDSPDCPTAIARAALSDDPKENPNG